MTLEIGSVTVALGATLREAMEVIDRGGVEIALLVDAQGRLVGTLTDGDVRRALLKGATLESPAERFAARAFTCVNRSAKRVEVLELMQSRRLGQIPILDDSGCLVGLHLLHEIVGCSPRVNCALIMAGGRGTRLYPLTETIPKPMLKVAGRPILERLILHCLSFGISRFMISVQYLGQVIEDHFGDGSRLGCTIQYLRETRPLGTGGALSLLPSGLEHPLVVLNGDLVTQVDIGRMLDFHESKDCRVTIGVRTYHHQVPFGCLELEGSEVRSIVEKPTLRAIINAGVYVLDPQVPSLVPKETDFPMTSLFERCLRKGWKVGAYEIEEDWIDVGRRDQLLMAREGGPPE